MDGKLNQDISFRRRNQANGIVSHEDSATLNNKPLLTSNNEGNSQFIHSKGINSEQNGRHDGCRLCGLDYEDHAIDYNIDLEGYQELLNDFFKSSVKNHGKDTDL